MQISKRASDQGPEPVCLTVSVEEAGRILGISRGTAYARADDGSLPTIRFGRRRLVPKAALEKLLSCV
jgi:excisionase family DNA binding protein